LLYAVAGFDGAMVVALTLLGVIWQAQDFEESFRNLAT
jgi:hypothetical protein